MKSTCTTADYDRVFEAERSVEYPEITAFEQQMGYAIDRSRLEQAARTLACPVKVNPPNWQHGRIIYAALRKYLEGRAERVRLLDIGTAKGFSALMMAFALTDSRAIGVINSVDVIDPEASQSRNSVLDIERVRTVREFVLPWAESDQICFHRSTGIDWLRANPERTHFAFIDGKHLYDAVLTEGRLLAASQEPGDVMIFDDLQIDGVRDAVVTCTFTPPYSLQLIQAKADRQYAIATKS